MLEAKIFKPYNRMIDSEEWPQLQLTNAVVYRRLVDKPDELCDLLDVQFTGPLRITGTLSRIPSHFNKMVKGKQNDTSDLVITYMPCTNLLPNRSSASRRGPRPAENCRRSC